MPKRTDIKRILVIGSGPIVIGQACEFDYSGTQACKALRAEGLEVVLVNSNPATIMTDPELADRTYVEPLTVGRARADHRARAARRAAADRGRADRAQPGGGARRGRHPREVRRRADRRVDRRHQGRRGPAAVPARRCARSASTCRSSARRAARWTRRSTLVEDARLPGDHPPVVHAGRRRRRHRLQPRGVPARSAGARPRA